MKSNVEIKMNCVIVIESLDKPNSTKKLYREEIIGKCESRSITHKYFPVNNKAELINLLNNLAGNEERLFPLIHFATHGNVEGLKLKEDRITWEELREPITKLNIASKNNVVLNMAACSGAFSIGLYEAETAPYHFMFGPQSDICEDDLENHLANFYKYYIDKPNLVEAFKFMKRQNNDEKVPFQVDSCIFMHQRIWKLICEEIDKGSARHELLSGLKEIADKESYEKLKSGMLYKEEIIEIYKGNYSNFKNKYFMSDLYPELEERFKNVETEFSIKYLK